MLLKLNKSLQIIVNFAVRDCIIQRLCHSTAHHELEQTLKGRSPRNESRNFLIT